MTTKIHITLIRALLSALALWLMQGAPIAQAQSYPAPWGVYLSQYTHNQYLLSWEPCVGASYYNVYEQVVKEGEDGANTFLVGSYSEPTTLNFSVGESETAWLWVRAVYVDAQGTHESSWAGGDSMWSGDVGEDPPPDSPGNLQITQHVGGYFNLTWDDPPSGNAAGVLVYRKVGNGDYHCVGGLSSLPYEEGVTYSFYVTAYNWSGESGASNEVTFNVAPRPTGFYAHFLANQTMALSWNPVGKPIDHYRVERADEGGDFVPLQDVASTTSTLIDTTVQMAHRYEYRVLSVNSDGDSEPSNSYQHCTLFPPVSVQATLIAGDAIRLNWSEVLSGVDYHVYRSTGPGDPGVPVGVTSALTIDDGPGLAEDTTYYYRIIVYLGSGSYLSDSSKEVVCYTPPHAPVLDAVQTLSNSSLKLSWPTVTSAGGGYEIYRTADPQTTYTLVGFSLAPSYVDATGLSEATHYWYKVRSRGVRGNSPLSDAGSGWTAPNPPTGLRVASELTASGNQMVLTWTDNSARESGYVVERSASGGVPWREFTVGQGAGVGGRISWRDSSGEVEEGKQYFYRVRALLNTAN